VVSDSWATRLGRLITPWLEIGSMDSEGGTVKVGVLRVGRTGKEAGGLEGGKIPGLAGPGCSKAGLGLGWNLRLVSTSEASLGLNRWKLVTAGTVGTLSWPATWGLALGDTNPGPGLNLLGGCGWDWGCLGTKENCWSDVTWPCGNLVREKSC